MIRSATADDIFALHALIHRAYRGDSARAGWTHEADLLDGQRTDDAALRAMLADLDQHLLVAIGEDGVLTGCVAVTRLGDGRGYLGLLTVDPSLQAKGLGRRLIAAAENCARDFGARAMEMTVIARRSELIAWYERRGYARTGEERPFPLDDVRFGLPKTRDLSFVVLARAL